MTKIQVPEGMLKAALDAKQMPHMREYEETVRPAIEAALQWLSENPIVPTDEQMARANPMRMPYFAEGVNWALEFQRSRMFLAEPEVPEEVKDLADRLFSNGTGQEAERLVLTSSRGDNLGGWCKKAVIDQIIEAFRSGQGCKGDRP